MELSRLCCSNIVGIAANTILGDSCTTFLACRSFKITLYACRVYIKLLIPKLMQHVYTSGIVGDIHLWQTIQPLSSDDLQSTYTVPTRCTPKYTVPDTSC